MIRVCFIQHASEGPLIEKLAKCLQKQGFEFKFVCKTKTAHEQYIKNGFESFFISEIFNKKKKLSQKELIDLDLKYGLPGIKSIFNSDLQLQAFFKKDNLEAERLIGLAYKFWEDFFAKHDIDYVISREIATFATRTAYNVAVYRKIPLLQIAGGPRNNLFIMSDVGKTSVWSELLDRLEDKKNIDSEQKKLVYDFIQERIPSIKNKMQLRFVPISFIKTVKNLLSILIRANKKNKRKDPIKIAALLYGKQVLMRRFKWKYFTKIFFKYDSFGENEKFIYFPLYSGNETGYLVDNHYWANNQISLIEEIAKSLPAEYNLYVKEHPTNLGYFSFGKLKYLQNFSNIKIIHPSFSSQNLIEKSKAVFVLQGTVGWEAFLSKKPVINLGTTFFSYSSLVYKINDISDISNVIWKVIKNGSKIYDNKKEEWLWFIHSVITTCGEGSIVKLEPPYGFILEDDNTKKMCDFISQKIKKDLKN